MLEDCLLSLLYAAWMAASTMPLGFMLGASCSPCCGCGVADGKPRTDPKDEGTWTLTGTWATAQANETISATFTANPGNSSGETWFFYGSINTSAIGGNATTEQAQDWGNLCNWYSNNTYGPHVSGSGTGPDLDKRASRLPPSTAVVHIYSPVSTVNVGPQTVKNAYFWTNAVTPSFSGMLLAGSEVTATASAHGTVHGMVFVGQGTQNLGTANGGVLFTAKNSQASSGNYGTVNDGARFVLGRPDGTNWGTVNDGAIFEAAANEGTVNGGAEFFDSSLNYDTVNDGAVFDTASVNLGTVNGGATFDNASENGASGTVNGGATFNGDACSLRFVGDYYNTPCDLQYVAHPTDLPTCNGTALSGCGGPGPIFQNCGCG
jgi:hypothetical protein